MDYKEKIRQPLQDMLAIKESLDNNIDVLKDKNIILTRLSFSEKNIPNFESETEYIAALCEGYINLLKDRDSSLNSVMYDIKVNKANINTLDNMKTTVPRNKLMSLMERYNQHIQLEEQTLDKKKDREQFIGLMEGLKAVFQNENVFSAAGESYPIRLSKNAKISMYNMAKDYYTNVALSESVKINKTGLQAIDEMEKEVKAFRENFIPKFTDKYNNDNQEIVNIAENLHVILDNYVRRINKWVE